MASFSSTLAVAALVALPLSGCGGDGDPQASIPESWTNVTEPIVGCTYNYQPMKAPQEMAKRTAFVVEGTIGRPRPGLLHFRKSGPPPRVETDIFPIEATRVLKPGNGRSRDITSRFGENPVFQVETGCAFRPPQRKAKLVSLSGRKALVYLVPHSRGMHAGRTGYGPAGQPRRLFQSASLEGFLVELASGDGVRDLELDQRYPGAELSQFLPDEPRFPPRN
ncbi:MAG: hypothetical protein ACSLFD_00350 [Solirubrobacterales bacterium]